MPTTAPAQRSDHRFDQACVRRIQQSVRRRTVPGRRDPRAAADGLERPPESIHAYPPDPAALDVGEVADGDARPYRQFFLGQPLPPADQAEEPAEAPVIVASHRNRLTVDGHQRLICG
jgi:hypothetical protein